MKYSMISGRWEGGLHLWIGGARRPHAESIFCEGSSKGKFGGKEQK